MFNKLLICTALAFSLTACDYSRNVSTPKERAPNPNINNNFVITNDIQAGPNKANVSIKREALGKEFLLSAQLVRLPKVPQFNGLKSRVVMFLEKTDTLYMLEAPDGHVVNNEIPARFVLAAFPILNKTEEHITFDFNSGMSQLYTSDEWRASDLSKSTNEFSSVNVKLSYIANMYMTESQKLVIRQVAQLQTASSKGNNNLGVEALFYISPYLPDENFVPTESKGFDRVGFFEVAPLLTDTRTKIYATKFGEGQVTYAISANTPELYREAVAEGILYWNKAFGYEKIKVVIAPEGVNAPNPDYNIVQWVNWDTAGMAYADAQADPRTGETLHAQVFQTSVFAIANKNRARAFLRKIKTEDSSSEESHSHIGLDGLSSKGLCNMNHSKMAQGLAETIITLDADEETSLRLSRDAVREVVAHEVGHTLGFRHNFAGNLDANFTALEVDQLFKDYVTTGNPGDALPTSSVMDYLRMESAMLAGAQLNAREDAFSYDQLAVNVLYKGATPTVDGPLYCTDSHRGKYFGCAVWDHGSSPVLDIERGRRNTVSNWSTKLIESYIKQLTSPGVRDQSVSAVALFPENDLVGAMIYRADFEIVLKKSTKDLRVYRSYNVVDGTNKSEVQQKQLKLWNEEIESLGGLKSLLDSPEAGMIDALKEATFKKLNSQQYLSGIGYDGENYNLSGQQYRDIQSALETYFGELERVAAKTDVTNLMSSKTELVNSELSQQLLDVYYERAIAYLLDKTDETIEAQLVLNDDEKTTINVKLPVFTYEQTVRESAIKLLTAQKAEKLDWSYVEKKALKIEFGDLIKSVLNDKSISDVDMAAISSEARVWLMQNKKLSGLLN